MRYHLLFALLLCTLFSSSIARSAEFPEDPYRFQVALLGTLEDSDGSSTNLYGVGISTVYPKVDVGDEPIAEGPFVQRVSMFSLIGIALQSTLDFGGGAEFDLQSEAIGGQFRFAHAGYPVAMEVELFFSSFDDSDTTNADFGGGVIAPVTLDIDQNSTSIGAKIWALPAPRAAIGIGYKLSTGDGAGSLFVGPPVGPTTTPIAINSESTELSIEGKYLLPVQDYWVNVEGGARMVREEDQTGGSPTENNHEFFVEGDFYLSRFLSVGLGATINNGDNKSNKGATYSGQVNFYYGTRASIELKIEQFVVGDDSQGDEDSTSYSLQFATLF